MGFSFEPNLATRMATRVASDASCTACHVNGTSMRAGEAPWQCSTPCLTPCERDEVVLITGKLSTYVYNQESWICRAVVQGYLHTDYQNEPFRLWATSMLVALLQLVGGLGTVYPANLPEIVAFFISILVGTILFAMIQGIIVQVLTTGDPDETEFCQKMDALNFMMRDNKLAKASVRACAQLAFPFALPSSTCAN